MKLLLAFLGSCLLACSALAQGDSVRVLRSVPTESPVIDGILEAEWWNAPAGSDFIQREPEEGVPSTQRTDVRVMHSPGARMTTPLSGQPAAYWLTPLLALVTGSIAKMGKGGL